MSRTNTESVARIDVGSDARPASGFHPALIDRLVRAEGRHFWFRARVSIRIIPCLNEVLLALLRLEKPIIARRGRVPLGSSLLAIARL